jgi:hypothetical protein
MAAGGFAASGSVLPRAYLPVGESHTPTGDDVAPRKLTPTGDRELLEDDIDLDERDIDWHDEATERYRPRTRAEAAESLKAMVPPLSDAERTAARREVDENLLPYWQRAPLYFAQPVAAQVRPPAACRGQRRTHARPRGRRSAPARRVVSRSAGGGSSGDADEGEPARGRRKRHEVAAAGGRR